MTAVHLSHPGSLLTPPLLSTPAVHFLWARDEFPNLVEEDQRVFVSHDGHLYFSSLETIDQGVYVCNVQSTISAIGKTGPKFRLDVEAHCELSGGWG